MKIGARFYQPDFYSGFTAGDYAGNSKFGAALKDLSSVKQANIPNVDLSMWDHKQLVSDIKAGIKTNGNEKILPNDAAMVKIAKLQIIAENSDYTDMNLDEIFTEIWQRYNNAFPGQMPAIYDCLAGGTEWSVIHNQLLDEFNAAEKFLRQKGQDISAEDCWRALSVMLGYSGLSKEEKQAAILQKYAGKNSVLDFLNMQSELFHAGVLRSKNIGDDGLFEFRHIIMRQELGLKLFPYEYIQQISLTQAQWDSVLYKDFDAVRFLAGLKTTLPGIAFSNYEFDIKGKLMNYLNEMIFMLEEQGMSMLF